MRRWLPSSSEEALKKSCITDEQIVKILRDAYKDPVANVAKRHAVSERMIYVWRRRFGEMASSDVKRFKDLVQENARPRRLVVQRDLEIDVMKENAAKKWWACRFAGSRWPTPLGAGSHGVGLVR